MKKIIICLFFISIFLVLTTHNEDIIIPNDAIRFRVIANSNSLEDQQEKKMIKEKIENEIYNLILGKSTTSEVKSLIENNLDTIEEIVASYQIPYHISYGNNYFPLKNYKGVIYPAGNYESLVITLGEGLGDNFWCVLFPPLCLMENTSEDISEVEYQFYIKKMLQKF